MKQSLKLKKLNHKCEQIASICCDNLEPFVVDIHPVKASLKVTQF